MTCRCYQRNVSSYLDSGGRPSWQADRFPLQGERLVHHLLRPAVRSLEAPENTRRASSASTSSLMLEAAHCLGCGQLTLVLSSGIRLVPV